MIIRVRFTNKNNEYFDLDFDASKITLLEFDKFLNMIKDKNNLQANVIAYI